MNVVTGGEGNDRLIVAQDSRITGGSGDDQFFLFFGNDNIEKDANDEVIDVFDDDLMLEITDFGDGSDKIMLVVNYNTHAEFINNNSDLIALFTSGTFIDHDSDGVLDDLRVFVSTTDSVSSVPHLRTIIFEDLGRQLTNEDFEVMSLDDYNLMVDEIQQSYLDMF